MAKQVQVILIDDLTGEEPERTLRPSSSVSTASSTRSM